MLKKWGYFVLCLNLMGIIPTLAAESDDFIQENPVIRQFYNALRGDTLWHHVTQTATPELEGKTLVFAYKNDDFEFLAAVKSKEEIRVLKNKTGFKRTYKFHSFVKNGLPILVFLKKKIEKSFLHTKFAETWADTLIAEPYNLALIEKARSVLINEPSPFSPYIDKSIPRLKKLEIDVYFNTGEEALQQGNMSEALTYFTLSYNDGNVRAAYLLGKLYANGTAEMVPNYIKAAKYFRDGAVNGEAASQFSFGMLYYNNSIARIDHDFEKAFSWCLLAALQGYKDAVKFIYEKQDDFLSIGEFLTEFSVRKGERA